MTVDQECVRGWFRRLGGVYVSDIDPDWVAALARIPDPLGKMQALMRIMNDRRAGAVAEMRAAGADAVFPVLTGLLAGGEPNERRGTVEAALLTDRERGVAFVLPRLRDADDTMRWTVCCHLRDHGDGRAVPALRDLLRRDLNANVRVAAVGALGRCGGPAVIPDLLTALDNHELDSQGHTPSSVAADALDDILGTSETRVRVGDYARLPDGPPDLDRLRRLAEECHRDWSANHEPDSHAPETLTAEYP